jgi:hypothetical protein
MPALVLVVVVRRRLSQCAMTAGFIYFLREVVFIGISGLKGKD